MYIPHASMSRWEAEMGESPEACRLSNLSYAAETEETPSQGGPCRLIPEAVLQPPYGRHAIFMHSTKIDTRNISKPLSGFFLFLSFLVLSCISCQSQASLTYKEARVLTQSELIDLQAASTVDDNCVLGILFVHLNNPPGSGPAEPRGVCIIIWARLCCSSP